MCDRYCLNYNALGICCHVVPTAEANNKLIEFSVYYQKLKKTSNFTDMATGRGRKESLLSRK